MKILMLILLGLTYMLGDSSKYEDRTYMSVGTLPDNVRIVCIDNEQWTEESQDNKIILDRIYYHDDELHKDVPLECDINLSRSNKKGTK